MFEFNVSPQMTVPSRAQMPVCVAVAREVFTFADRPGDRMLASYVKDQIGGDSCGTEIKVVDTQTYKVWTGDETKSIQKLLDGIQNRFESKLKKPGVNVIPGKSPKWFGTIVFRSEKEQAASRFYNWKAISAEDLCSKVESLKREGVPNDSIVQILTHLLSSFPFSNEGGKHSEGGNAKLKPALKKFIEKHSKMCHSGVRENDGMIRVRWVY